MNTLRRLLTPVVVVLAIASNAVPWNGKTPGDVADARRTVLDAAPFTFSIWLPIFALSVVWAVYTQLPRNRDNPLLQRTGWPALLVVAASGVWPPVVAHGHHVAGTGIILAMLGLLFVVDLRGQGARGADFWCARFGFAVERGWITAAAVLSLTAVAQHDAGFDIDAAAGLVALAAVFAIAVGVLYVRGDPTYALVVAWAFFGIAAQNGFAGSVGATAAAGAAGLVAITAGRSVLRLARSRARADDVRRHAADRTGALPLPSHA